MPVLDRSSRGTSSAVGLHYIDYGTYDLKSGRINQPHATRGDKSITERNYLSEGLSCPDDYKGAVKLYSHYNRQKPNNKIQCTNIVIAFGPDFDWRNPEDLFRGMHIVHKFNDVCFPMHPCYTGYQMDTSGKKPSAHVHDCVGQFNLLTGKSLTGDQYNIEHLRYVINQITNEYNAVNVKSITDMQDYAMHGMKSHRHLQPTLAQRRLFPRLGILLYSHAVTDDRRLVTLACPLGIDMHLHHKGDSRATKRHPYRKPYKYESLTMRIPGQQGTNGYQYASKLRWFGKFLPNIDQLHNEQSRHQMYAYNQQYLNDNPVMARLADKAGRLANIGTPSADLIAQREMKKAIHVNGDDVLLHAVTRRYGYHAEAEYVGLVMKPNQQKKAKPAVSVHKAVAKIVHQPINVNNANRNVKLLVLEAVKAKKQRERWFKLNQAKIELKRQTDGTMANLSTPLVKKSVPLLTDTVGNDKQTRHAEKDVKSTKHDNGLIHNLFFNVKAYAEVAKHHLRMDFYHVSLHAGDWLERHHFITHKNNVSLHDTQRRIVIRRLEHEKHRAEKRQAMAKKPQQKRSHKISPSDHPQI